jgi:hypothetical protein
MPTYITRSRPDGNEELIDLDEEKFDGPPCPVCGAPQERVACWRCQGEGETEDGELYESDPLWYDPEDVEPCSECQGKGRWWECPNAGQPGHGVTAECP